MHANSRQVWSVFQCYAKIALYTPFALEKPSYFKYAVNVHVHVHVLMSHLAWTGQHVVESSQVTLSTRSI